MGVITDPIADMLTRIRNANTANHQTVDIPDSKMKRSIAAILKEEGFIRDFEVVAEGPQGTLRITLKYGPDKEKVITGLRRISRPGLRVYAARADIPRVLGGLGLVIVSTSRGVMSGKRAKREGYGGEVLAYVW
jgi:small subunit ribosomal protein S8